ncbi:aminotransferase class III-fold pyridoxal phosphate-dependent enzyme [Pelagovum pacificum]|uniref:Aminotransferase class III-fold pyridoxal phosphate-dependent enzyme n=1 Tax=Pelagovum pacificum TaxID=2588711 RepID=A0A5C5GA80_9RHOB|nr:aminotransferase class III-fold pyridoxal phosphate-dependent enzyme [Pelagovum pacificum]QQA42380.1 aminotransferase class III-fold pyridoxal phosphate-dependent enzyme [Pelagovum pacificum]TNY31463.1 aminotransferase class III-fold pyridoxal phosphate-dependent enzyme [Pelagovum pacificum]
MALDAKTNSLEEYWIPFTDNRGFKKDPRLVVQAEGVWMTDHKGGKVIDGSSGLFCSPAGHCHPKIVEAVHKAMSELTFVSPFSTNHPLAFALAEEVARITPEGLNHVFFTNSGSESIDTAMKIVMAYHTARGENRRHFVSREKAYHGVNIGGVSLSGLVNNRRAFPVTMPGIVHMRHTLTEMELKVPGQRVSGLDRAEDLQRIIDNYGAETIAAVFVEPVGGSAGCLPPPVGYLKRLREICDQHGLLLVFDEVITGFGRVGGTFAADAFEVVPDIITMAKAITNGSMPMGAVAVRDDIYETVTDKQVMGGIELFHGYTYSGHPGACAAGLAALSIYREEGLMDRAAELAPYFQEALHSLADHALVKDIRSIGMMGAVELFPGEVPGVRGVKMQSDLFWNGCHVKFTGENGIFAPMFISEKSDIDLIVGKFRETLDTVE